MRVQEALNDSGIEVREARLLLAEATGFSQPAVLAFQERILNEEAQERFLEFVSRRKRGEPIAYIVGHKEFYGLELAVNPAVLIPRPETELLVELALERKPSTVLDLGTGSGAVALAIKKHLARAKVVAIESSAAALAVARRNATKHGLEVEFRHGRWFDGVTEQFDVIVANPPYVAEGDPHLKDLAFEPPEALLAGPDGLDAIRHIAREAPGHLSEGGWLLLEHGHGQDAAVRALLPLEEVRSWPDLAGIPRVTGGRR